MTERAAPQPAVERARIPPGLALAAAVFAMSWSGPLVRFTDAPALAVAAWRLTLSVAIIAALAALRGRRLPVHGIEQRDLTMMVLAGVLLAAHFWTWIASLDYTTVASSVALVSMQPFFVALLSGVVLRERPSRRQWLGIGLAVAGAIAIGWGDFALGRDALFGDALALAGAVFVSGYYIIGRGVRRRLDLEAYIFTVYGVAAVVLMAAAITLPSVSVTGHGTRDWLVFVALAAGPMMIGHTGINYALRYVPAYVANLAILCEPIGATLIAWWLPAIGERPGPQLLAGGTLILAGIAVGSTRGRERRER